MSTLSRLTRNHANHAVPPDEQVGGVRIALVIVGVAITLPAFLLGAEIIHGLGAVRGITAIFCGGLILTATAMLTMTVGARSKLTTYAITQFAYGRTGARVVNLVLSITLFGWYGVTAMLFGQACQRAVLELFAIDWPLAGFIAAGSVLMVVTTVFGFRAIEKLSRLSVPLMLAALFACIYSVLQHHSLGELAAVPGNSDSRLSSMGMAISAVVGTFMVGVTIVADMSRFSRRPRDSVVAALGSYGSFSMLILVMAGIPILVTGEKDLMRTLYEFGLGTPALIIMIFATWTTNTSNLYSASLSIAQALPFARDWVITVTAGVAGTVLALSGVMVHFVDFLLLLGITVPPIAGIYMVDFFVLRRGRYQLQALDGAPAFNIPAFIAWALAVAVAALSSKQVLVITTIPACDAIVCAALCYLVSMRLAGRRFDAVQKSATQNNALSVDRINR
ncbi:cytosine permease [Exilibacterium tricleocarpae]|uniref:Cytosine permease n=1 Tax=Exilibacterium tricleocarpae TaxID=2591008 RepID=A0A545SQL3_9GAMM|nr:cytosine permease [Exilibacterium tricleocarpae]TQV67249.1 cytosine permease [Exilibacterium tricleocarpae]